MSIGSKPVEEEYLRRQVRRNDCAFFGSPPLPLLHNNRAALTTSITRIVPNGMSRPRMWKKCARRTFADRKRSLLGHAVPRESGPIQCMTRRKRRPIERKSLRCSVTEAVTPTPLMAAQKVVPLAGGVAEPRELWRCERRHPFSPEGLPGPPRSLADLADGDSSTDRSSIQRVATL